MSENEYPKEKECTHCHQFKLLGEFSKDKTGKYGCQSWCKLCSRKRDNDKYANDLEFREHKLEQHNGYRNDRYGYDLEYRKDHIELNNNLNKVKRKENLIWINKIKLNCGCIICGYADNPSKLDFHHPVDDKVDNISHMIECYSEKKILKEICKCNILCKSCHRQLHLDGKEYLKEQIEK